jgi:transposase
VLVAHRSGRDMRIKLLNQLRHLGFCAPDELRELFRGVTVAHLAREAAGLRPNPDQDPVTYATMYAMQTLGRRVVNIEADTTRLNAELAALVRKTAPSLVALPRGRHPHRRAAARRRRRQRRPDPHRSRVRPPLRRRPDPRLLRQDHPPRLNPGGNRQANHALWRIVFTRMSSDPRTRAYVERRRAQGRSTREIMRVLKRYVAREVYRHLPST